MPLWKVHWVQMKSKGKFSMQIRNFRIGKRGNDKKLWGSIMCTLRNVAAHPPLAQSGERCNMPARS